MAVFQLNNNEISFPNPELAEENGLLAIGGDFTWERLRFAYSLGIFPWSDIPIRWYCTKPRFVLFPSEVRVSKSMSRILKKNCYEVRYNTCFREVITSCQQIREQKDEDTWINPHLIEGYVDLFNHGYATSVETFHNGELVGGLYGVDFDHCFWGESMFAKESNASKIALINLCNRLENENYRFIDCQIKTQHLQSMGGRFITWKQFKEMLPYFHNKK